MGNRTPDQYCGFELEIPPSADRKKWHKRTKAVCCWRETWRDNDHCIWHTKAKNKPIEDLKSSRSNIPERLDGAFLLEVEAGNNLSLQGCNLRSANFSHSNFRYSLFNGSNLTNTQFHDVDLRYAEFHKATLTYAEFHNSIFFDTKFQDTDLDYTKFHEARVISSEFHNATLSSAEFHDARLAESEFYNGDLCGAKFHDALALRVEFYNADLTNTKFHNTGLYQANFHSADLTHAEFCGADISDAEFCDANLSVANCTDANARNTDFTHAILHDTLLTRADCRGATFTNALLYEAVFADTRVNSQTMFYDPEATFYNSITSRPAVVYEENPATEKDLPENIHPLGAAEWVYRRLEKLHDENALSEDARNFHISKKEAQRKSQFEAKDYTRYIISTLQRYLTGYGESIARIFGSAACLILACGILYPLVGGFESASTGETYRIYLSPIELSRTAILDNIAIFLQSIYFSVITFTTIGYGDLYPTGTGSKILVGFESLSGAILIALFVFILGRRVAR